MSNSINRQSAEQLIWKACNEAAGPMPAGKYLEVALEMLLWARWIPSSEGETTGYFDAMRSLGDVDEWESIKDAVAQRSGARSPLVTRVNKISIGALEQMRASLLPIGRALNGTDATQRKAVIEAMTGLAYNENRGQMWGSPSIQLLWESLLACHPGAEVACLFRFGVTAAPCLGIDHRTLFSCPNPELDYWISALLSLYPEPAEMASLEDRGSWSVAIAASTWGEKTQDLLEQDSWLPSLPLDCPAAIRDVEARRVYAAHQRCDGTTYAWVSPGVGFRTSRDMEYFREELVQNSWLDAVISLPPGGMASTALKSMLLVLKKNRSARDPILFISAESLLAPSRDRGSRQGWDATGISKIVQILTERRETSCSRMVSAEEIESNSYSFQVGRYLRSEADLTLQGYIESRATLQLGDLAEIKRPVASLGRQDDEGVEVREVAPVDIDDSGQLRSPSKMIRLPEIALTKGRQYLLEPGDVLMSIKGGLGRVAVVDNLEGPTVAGQAFCVIRLRPNAPLTPSALAQYLRSTVGQYLLQKASQGGSVAFVPMGEVKCLRVVVPSKSEQQRSKSIERESMALSKEIRELGQKLEQIERQGWLQDPPPSMTGDDLEKYYTPRQIIDLLAKEALK
jgi:hypothetical protein